MAGSDQIVFDNVSKFYGEVLGVNRIHLTIPPGIHFFFPGPVDADPATSPNAGHDPSLITDFSGVIAQADLIFSGKGTDLNSGQSATYDFHADMRFMSGVFVGLDNEQHNGTFGFI